MIITRKIFTFDENDIKLSIDDEDIDTKDLLSMTFEAISYRKANYIHNFFVKNVQNKVDDCGTYSVSREILQKLIDYCKEDLAYLKTLETNVVVNKKPWDNPKFNYNTYLNVDEEKLNLPCISGFFFGSMDYDQYYSDELERTVKVLEEEIIKKGSFYYNSSW